MTPNLIARREAVARASRWLRECSSWMLSNDFDMQVPNDIMEFDPLDIADELDAILALESSPTPVSEDASRSPVSEERAALHRCERIAEMKVEQCLQRADGRGVNDAKDTHRKIRAVAQAILAADEDAASERARAEYERWHVIQPRTPSPQPQASPVSEDAPRSHVLEDVRCRLEANIPVGQIDARVRRVIIDNVMAAFAPSPQPQAVSEDAGEVERHICDVQNALRSALTSPQPHPVAEPVSKTPDSEHVAGGGE